LPSAAVHSGCQAPSSRGYIPGARHQVRVPSSCVCAPNRFTRCRQARDPGVAFSGGSFWVPGTKFVWLHSGYQAPSSRGCIPGARHQVRVAVQRIVLPVAARLGTLALGSAAVHFGCQAPSSCGYILGTRHQVRVAAFRVPGTKFGTKFACQVRVAVQRIV
jgi:hypothetical protein